MTALLGYQTALLLGSQRWLAPLVLYAVLIADGVLSGRPLESLGYAAAALLPITAWLVRLCANQEPAAARDVVAAASGPVRAHAAALLAATGCAGALGVIGTGAVLLGKAADPPRGPSVPLAEAAVAGLLAAAACALTGAAIGALCTRPVLRHGGWSWAATVLVSLLALVVPYSPANRAVFVMVDGAGGASAPLPLLPLAAALALACAAFALTTRLTRATVR
ncbi:ABC transporter [Streptomyces sp. NPDC047315]|uniref:ABC transporter n=1 Tax=Streptomyces sp. NPDC047315 TaxID=3155142 RepID=UPI0033E4521C